MSKDKVHYMKLELDVNADIVDAFSDMQYFITDDEDVAFANTEENRDMLSNLFNRHAALSLVETLVKLVKHYREQNNIHDIAHTEQLKLALNKAKHALRLELSTTIHISIGLVNESVINHVKRELDELFARDDDSLIEKAREIIFDAACV